MNKGFTKTYRKELESDIWKMPPLYQRVFFYIRLKVKYKTETFPTRKKFSIWLLPGQLITSMDNIAQGVSWQEWGKEKVPNKKTIKTIIDWLESNDMIGVVSNAYGTYIELVNWGLYHPADFEKVTESNQEWVTEKKRLLDTIKELKRIKKKSLKKEPKTYVIPENEIVLPEWLPLEEWGEFVKMRNRIKKPLTDYAIKLAINKLAKFREEGQPVAEILGNSIFSSYQGLFSLDGKKPKAFKTKAERNQAASKEALAEFYKSQEKDITP